MVHERRRVLAVTSTALVLAVLVWFNYPAVLPQVIDEWGLSGVEAGVVLSAFQAGYLLVIIPVGTLADRYSERWVMAVGATGTGLASLAFALVADGVLSGIALRFLAGLFMAGVYVPGMRFVSAWYPERIRGRAMGVYVGAYSTSSGLSFLFSSSVAAAVNWRTAIAATSVVALAVGPLMLGLTRDAPAPDSARTDGTGSAGDSDSGSGDGSNADETVADDATVDTSSSGTVRFDLSVLGNRAYLHAVGVYSWHSWELFGVRSWMLAFLVTLPAVSTAGALAGPGGGVGVGASSLAGTLMGLTMIVGGPGNFVGGWLSDRIGRLTAIGIALAASATISLSLAVLGAFDAFGVLSLPVLTALLFVYGVTLTADSAPTSTAITELVNDDTMGAALSIQSFVGFGATVVSPIVFGLALDAGGYGLAFSTLAAGAAMGLLSVLALRRRASLR